MADVHHADPAGEVHVPLAADVPELRAFGAVCGDRVPGRDAAGDVLRAQLGQLRLGRLVPHRHAAIQADTIRVWWTRLARRSHGCGRGSRPRSASLAAGAPTGTSRR